jgi:hypothetical protein
VNGELQFWSGTLINYFLFVRQKEAAGAADAAA